MLESIKFALKQIIINDLKVDISLENIKDEDSLYEDGVGLDSINIVEFIVLIEERFSINIEEIDSSMFASLQSLAYFINSKIEH